MTLMRRDLLLSGTLAAAAMTAARPVLAQSATPELAAGPSSPPKDVKAIAITNLFDLEDDAKKGLPPDTFNYIAAGSGNNWTRYENVVAFDRVHIEPQPLS